MCITKHVNCQTIAVTVPVAVAVSVALALAVAVLWLRDVAYKVCHRVPASQPVRVDCLTVAVNETESILLRCYHREHLTVATQSYQELLMLAVATMNLMHVI